MPARFFPSDRERRWGQPSRRSNSFLPRSSGISQTDLPMPSTGGGVAGSGRRTLRCFKQCSPKRANSRSSRGGCDPQTLDAAFYVKQFSGQQIEGQGPDGGNSAFAVGSFCMFEQCNTQ